MEIEETGASCSQNDFFQAKHVLDGRLSPDSRFAVYQLSETGDDGENGFNSLWLVNLDSNQSKRLTAPGVSAWQPVFSPAGDEVFYLSNSSPTSPSQVHRLALDGGNPVEITALPTGVVGFALSPNGERLALSSFQSPPKPRGPQDHLRVKRSRYRFDGIPGHFPDMFQAIHVHPVSGSEDSVVVPCEGIVAEMVWSPDNVELAFSVVAQEEYSGPTIADLNVINAAGDVEKILKGYRAMQLFWTPDGGKLAFSGGPSNHFSKQPQLWVIGRDGKELHSRSAALDLPVGALIQINSPAAVAPSRFLFNDEADAVFAPVCRGGEMRICRISMEGADSCDEVVGGTRSCKPLDYRNGTLLFTSQDFTAPSELRALKLDSGEEQLVTDQNASWRVEAQRPLVERLTVQSTEAAEVEGWVMIPNNLEPPYKTVLYIHGGPHAGFGYGYNEDVHELVEAGYAVVLVNTRGSTGYGDSYSASIIGRWGELEQADLESFLNALVKRGVADPDYLSVMGYSGGGHLAAWLICQTDRFKAAIAEQGIYNLISMWGASDMGVALLGHEMGGSLYEEPELYWALSPLAHAHKCTTPTLLIQGEDDLRCPMEQAEQMFTALKANGCETELLRMMACNHGATIMGPLPLRKARMAAVKDWLARFM